MKKRTRRIKQVIVLIFAFLVAAMVLLQVLYYYTGNLNSESMEHRSEVVAIQIEDWSSEAVSQLGIYRTIMEKYMDDEEIAEYITSTYYAQEAFPMGLYIGDSQGCYFDAAGWEPEEDYVITERPWYVQAKDSRKFTFSEPYTDAMLGTTIVSVSAKMECNDAIRVMAADVYLDYCQNQLSAIVNNGYVDGALLLSPEMQYLANAHRDLDVMENDFLNSERTLDQKIYELLENGETGIIMVDVDGEKYYVDIFLLETTRWYLVTYVAEDTFAAPIEKVQEVLLVFVAAVLLLMIFLLWKFSKTTDVLNLKAVTDKLTGIMNREGFESHVKENLEHSGSAGAKGWLLLLDLDHFKSINDNLGHPEGDRLLVLFASVLHTYFWDKSDLPARIGGDEFAVYLGRDLSREEMEELLTELLEEIRVVFAPYKKYGLSVSIGGGKILPEEAYKDIYARVDKCLYEVKNSGKDHFVLDGED